MVHHLNDWRKFYDRSHDMSLTVEIPRFIEEATDWFSLPLHNLYCLISCSKSQLIFREFVLSFFTSLLVLQIGLIRMYNYKWEIQKSFWFHGIKARLVKTKQSITEIHEILLGDDIPLAKTGFKCQRRMGMPRRQCTVQEGAGEWTGLWILGRDSIVIWTTSREGYSASDPCLKN